MRLFIGIPLPGEYARIIGALQTAWKARLASRVSWVRPELAHVTLKFLGEVEERRVADIVRAMRAARWKGFALRGGAGGFFPSRGAPRVAWLGFGSGAPECGRCFGALDQELATVGFDLEARPFVPHVTVARIKDAARGDDWAALAADLTRDWPVFSVDRVVLWQSILHPSGPRYQMVAEVVPQA
jgi:2'-5' RNA ligase